MRSGRLLLFAKASYDGPWVLPCVCDFREHTTNLEAPGSEPRAMLWRLGFNTDHAGAHFMSAIAAGVLSQQSKAY